jgi:hypothetical protein
MTARAAAPDVPQRHGFRIQQGGDFILGWGRHIEVIISKVLMCIAVYIIINGLQYIPRVICASSASEGSDACVDKQNVDCILGNCTDFYSCDLYLLWGRRTQQNHALLNPRGTPLQRA